MKTISYEMLVAHRACAAQRRKFVSVFGKKNPVRLNLVNARKAIKHGLNVDWLLMTFISMHEYDLATREMYRMPEFKKLGKESATEMRVIHRHWRRLHKIYKKIYTKHYADWVIEHGDAHEDAFDRHIDKYIRKNREYLACLKLHQAASEVFDKREVMRDKLYMLLRFKAALPYLRGAA